MAMDGTPKTLVDRLVSWLTATSIVIGGLYGLIHYVGDINDHKVQETLKFVREYHAVPNERQGDSVRYVFEKLLDAYGGVRLEARSAQIDVIRVLDFFTTVAICALEGACHGDTTFQYFGANMRSFIRAECHKFDSLLKEWNQNYDVKIVQFLIEHDRNMYAGGANSTLACDRYSGVARRPWYKRWP